MSRETDIAQLLEQGELAYKDKTGGMIHIIQPGKSYKALCLTLTNIFTDLKLIKEEQNGS